MAAASSLVARRVLASFRLAGMDSLRLFATFPPEFLGYFVDGIARSFPMGSSALLHLIDRAIDGSLDAGGRSALLTFAYQHIFDSRNNCIYRVVGIDTGMLRLDRTFAFAFGHQVD